MHDRADDVNRGPLGRAAGLSSVIPGCDLFGEAGLSVFDPLEPCLRSFAT